MKNYWLGGLALVAFGVVLGAIGQHTLWFGLAKQHITVDNCQLVFFEAPYGAWGFGLKRDGSAILVASRYINYGDVGFSPGATLSRTLGAAFEKRSCRFPPGTFDFPAFFRDLYRKRQTHSKGHYLDYSEMSCAIKFLPPRIGSSRRVTSSASTRPKVS